MVRKEVFIGRGKMISTNLEKMENITVVLKSAISEHCTEQFLRMGSKM